MGPALGTGCPVPDADDRAYEASVAGMAAAEARLPAVADPAAAAAAADAGGTAAYLAVATTGSSGSSGPETTGCGPRLSTPAPLGTP